MDLELTETERMLRDTFRDYFTRQIEPQVAAGGQVLGEDGDPLKRGRPDGQLVVVFPAADAGEALLCAAILRAHQAEILVVGLAGGHGCRLSSTRQPRPSCTGTRAIGRFCQAGH